MWLLDNPNLPIAATYTPHAAPLCVLNPGYRMAPLCQVDFQAAQPGVTLPDNPTTVVDTVPTYSGNTVTLPLGNLVSVSAIGHNGRNFTPAADDSHPLPGEFVVVNGAIVVTVDRAHSLIPGLPVQILGGTEALPTDYVDAGLFAALKGLPVVGEFSWSLSLENHPSGSLKLLVQKDGIEQVRDRFRKGSEITLVEIGFHVSGYREKLFNAKDYPGIEYEVSVSLGGKWERKKYNRPTFLNPNAAQRISATSGIPYLDPECSIGVPAPGQTSANRFRAYKTSVQQLASQCGVPFVAPVVPVLRDGDAIAALQSSTSLRDWVLADRLQTAQSLSGNLGTHTELDAWAVPIPKDSAREAAIEWEPTARERLRPNGCLIDFCSPDAVYARELDDTKRWRYQVPELEWSNQGDCEFSEGRFGYAVEYPGTRITGIFSEVPFPEIAEDIQNLSNQPPRIRWKRKEPNIRVHLSGDIDADVCPPEIQQLKSLSLNAAASGRTQELIEVTTVDGIETLKRRWVYGLVYRSTDVADNDGKIDTPAAPWWRLVQEETTETFVDTATGYVLGSRTVGRQFKPFKMESDEKLELTDLDPTDPKYDLYKYRWIESVSVEKKLLVPYSTYFTDAQTEHPPYDTYKRCNPDGTSKLIAIKDPNYTPPLFELASRTFKSSFVSVKNPDSEPDAPLPDLTQGEEVDIYKFTNILPNPNARRTYTSNLNPFADPSNDSGKEGNDMYLERTYENSAQGANFSEISTRRTFATNEGRPGAAQRRAALYEKEQYEPNAAIDPNQWQDPNHRQKYEWIICSPGYDPLTPSTSSQNFATAKYFSQALRGLKTDFKVRDVQESVEFNYAVPFNSRLRPFDRVEVSAADGERYATRAVSIDNRVVFQGLVGDYPFCVAPDGTKIRAGIDREVPLNVVQRPLPIAPYPPPKPSALVGMAIGDLEIRGIRTRGDA